MKSSPKPWKRLGYKTLVSWANATDEGKEYRRAQASRYRQERRLRLADAGGPGMTRKDRLSVLKHWGHQCAYCGAAQGEPRYYGSVRLEMDHVVPIPVGLDCCSNIVLACSSCNSSKGDRDLIQWALAKDIILSSKVLLVYYENKCHTKV